MKIKNLYILCLLLLGGIFTSCEKEEPEIDYTSVGKAAGQWNVTYKVETSAGKFEDIYDVGYTTLSTYNTAADTGEQIWIDDEGHFWPFKFKSGFNAADMTFSATAAPSIVKSNNKDFTVNVTQGKVILGGGLSKTKVPVDSIYFRAEFSDDPGIIYHISGHRVTGFVEGEY